MHPDDKEAHVATETQTGWASTNPRHPGGTKFHHYTNGVSSCSYQRKAGALTFMAKQTASVTNGLCSSCENNLRKAAQAAQQPKRQPRSSASDRAGIDYLASLTKNERDLAFDALAQG